MLSAWRKAKISGHCLKPVFFFPVNDENWLTETHPYLRLSLNPFFQWSSHVYRVAIFERKRWKETISFSFPVYHYLWTQHRCQQSSINYAWIFLGSSIFFLTEKRKRKMLSRWRTRKINDQIDHCSGLAERILGIKVTNLAESLRNLLFLNINCEIFYFLFFQFKTIFFFLGFLDAKLPQIMFLCSQHFLFNS